MNGYAAVYEVRSSGTDATLTDEVFTDGIARDRTGPDRIGTVHAAEIDDSGTLPGPLTLCGMSTADLRPAPGDRPGEAGESWWPPISGAVICAACDRDT
ncbi:hypothetical protein [Streptomyces sp. NPDC001568]|uniref:hypothetical protein n=1 Tax=Streptomyces sp. NPDC001568 TaxID=3364588 RepID=UPI0036B9ADD5